MFAFSCSVLINGLTPIYLFSRHYFSLYYWHIYPYIMPFVYPVGMIAQSSREQTQRKTALGFLHITLSCMYKRCLQ